jgi:hypothetical protein
MGIGVFFVVYFGIPGRVFLLWVWVFFLLYILGFQEGYISYGDGGLFCFFSFRVLGRVYLL